MQIETMSTLPPSLLICDERPGLEWPRIFTGLEGCWAHVLLPSNPSVAPVFFIFRFLQYNCCDKKLQIYTYIAIQYLTAI